MRRPLNQNVHLLLLALHLSVLWGCSVQRQYAPEHKLRIQDRYLHQTISLPREAMVWEWAAGLGGDFYSSVYLDGEVTDYVSLNVGTLRDYLSKGDIRIGGYKFYHIRRLPRRMYGIRILKDEKITDRFTAPNVDPAKDIALGPYRTYRLAPGTAMFVKRLERNAYSPPDAFFCNWTVEMFVHVEVYVPQLGKKVDAVCGADEFVGMVE